MNRLSHIPAIAGLVFIPTFFLAGVLPARSQPSPTPVVEVVEVASPAPSEVRSVTAHWKFDPNEQPKVGVTDRGEPSLAFEQGATLTLVLNNPAVIRN